MPYLAMLTKVKNNLCIRPKIEWSFPWPMLLLYTKFHANHASTFSKNPADNQTALKTLFLGGGNKKVSSRVSFVVFCKFGRFFRFVQVPSGLLTATLSTAPDKSISKTSNICMEVRKRAHKYEFFFPRCNAVSLGCESERSGSLCFTLQLHALPLAPLAPSIVYSLDFAQSMSGDEPNSKIPLC